MTEPVFSSRADALNLDQPAPRRPRRRPIREGRAWIRYPYQAEICFQALERRKEGTWRPARVRDISTKGLGLSLDAQVPNGAILSIKLEAASQRLTQPLLVRVVRAGEQLEDGWQIGCTFAIPLSEQDLRTLVPTEEDAQGSEEDEMPSRSQPKSPGRSAAHDPFSHGSTDERRTHPRRRIAVPVILSSIPAFGESPVVKEALAIDASGGGIKLLGRDCLGRGTILRLRGAKAPPSTSVEVRVKSCCPQQTKWLIGVQFLQPPPSEFMLFFQ
jgi:hypothetical protein